jgi:hypothetical protein
MRFALRSESSRLLEASRYVPTVYLSSHDSDYFGFIQQVCISPALARHLLGGIR